MAFMAEFSGTASCSPAHRVLTVGHDGAACFRIELTEYIWWWERRSGRFSELLKMPGCIGASNVDTATLRRTGDGCCSVRVTYFTSRSRSSMEKCWICETCTLPCIVSAAWIAVNALMPTLRVTKIISLDCPAPAPHAPPLGTAPLASPGARRTSCPSRCASPCLPPMSPLGGAC